MINRIRINIAKIYNCIDWIIPIVFVSSFLSCLSPISFVGDLAKAVSILLSTLLLVGGGFKRSIILFNLVFAVFILSIFAYLYNDRPLICASADLINLLPSMLFFLVGLNDVRDNRNFYEKMMYVGSIILLIGIVCYVMMPPWYTSCMLEYKNNNQISSGVEYSESTLYETLRFYCFFKDSYPVSLFSIYILSVSLFSFFRKDHIIKYSFLCCVISLISAILCMHRVSIACGIIIIMIFFAYEILRYGGKKVFKIVGIIVAGCILLYFLFDTVQERLDSIGEMIGARTEDMSFSSAYNERQELSDKLMKQWAFPLFGHGIGSGGPTARFLGYGGVTDAAYTKLLFENGIIGTVLFMGLAFISILRGIEYLKYYIAEVSVICFILIAMAGSNTIYMPYEYIIPFWYMMGRIWNRHYLRYAVVNRIHI